MTVLDFNVTARLALRARDLTDEQADKFIDRLAAYDPAATAGPFGDVELILTLPATGLPQATTTALALMGTVDIPTVAITVEPTVDFDRRTDLEALPNLVSVTEAAELLGVTRTSVQKAIDAGTLAATKIGSTWVLRRSVVEHRAAASS